MANEFIVKNGLISKGNITSSGGIQAPSLSGTASYANNAVSASNAITAQTASYLPVGTYNITSSWSNNATSASVATSASYAPNTLSGGTSNYVPLWTSATTLSSSAIYQSGTNIGINTAIPNAPVHISSSLTGQAIILNIQSAGQNPGIQLTGTDRTAAIYPNGRSSGIRATTLDLWTDNAAYINFYSSNGATNYGYVGQRSATVFGITSNNDLQLGAGGSTQVFISGSGNVGIGTTVPLNKLDVAGNISASNITASLFFGTASVSNSGSVSLVSNNVNYYFDLSTATSGIQPTVVASGLTFNPSTNTLSGSSITIIANAFTGSHFGTSSWSNNAVTAALATSINFTASNATLAQTASSINFTPNTANTASYILASNIAGTIANATSASYALSSSYATNANNAVLATTAGTANALNAANTYSLSQLSASGTITAPTFIGSLTGTSSWANNSLTASYVNASNVIGTVNNATSASYSLTSSYALNAGGTLTTGSTYPITSSWANNALTSALATSINFTASNATTAQTASYLTPANSYAITNLTASSNVSASGNLIVNNVGIGTNTPAEKLHISSSATANIRIQSSNNCSVQFVGPHTNSYAIGLDQADSDKFKVSWAASTTPPALGSTDYLTIDATGKVGIGTNSPKNNLDVKGIYGAVIGNTYAGVATAPANGLLVQGNVGIGTNSVLSGVNCQVASAGPNTLIAISSLATTASTATNAQLSFDIGTNPYGVGSFDWRQVVAPFPSGTITQSKYFIDSWKDGVQGSVRFYLDDIGNASFPNSKLSIGGNNYNPVNQLDVYGNISASNITASRFTGTASFADTASVVNNLNSANSYTVANLTATNTLSASVVKGNLSVPQAGYMYFPYSSALSPLTAALATGSAYVGVGIGTSAATLFYVYNGTRWTSASLA